ncbi:hypothetical protein QEN19_000665 [Hanseniaspora menglaensis]
MDTSQSESLSPTMKPATFSGSSGNTLYASDNGFHLENDNRADAHKELIFVESNRAMVTDAVALNNKQLLLANLYHYFIDNQNYKSAIALLKEADVPIKISENSNSKLKPLPVNNRRIYKINHPECEIELYENEYLKSESSVPSKGTFLLQWWECLWSLYNFINSQPLELVSTIRPFIDFIKPILPETNAAMSPIANINSPASFSSQNFFSQQQQQYHHPPTRPQSTTLMKNSPVNQQNQNSALDSNYNKNQSNNQQRILKDNNSSSSSPFQHQDGPAQNNYQKPLYNDSDTEYMRNFQDFASASNFNNYTSTAHFQKRLSKSHLPAQSQNHSSSSPGQFYSSSYSNPVKVANNTFIDKNKSNEYLNKQDAKFYPSDGIFKPISNNVNDQNTLANYNLSGDTSDAKMYQNSGSTADISNHNIQKHTLAAQSSHINMKSQQYPVNQFSNMQQMFNQQVGFVNNGVDQTRNNGVFGQSYMENNMMEQRPSFTQPSNVKLMSTQNTSQQNPNTNLTGSSSAGFNGNMPLNDQQMHIKNMNFASLQMNNQHFNSNNMQNMMPQINGGMPGIVNGGIPPNGMSFKMQSSYPSIPEGSRLNSKEMIPVVNNQYQNSRKNSLPMTGNVTGDLGMGNSDDYNDFVGGSKKRKSKALSSTSTNATPNNGYMNYNNASYRQPIYSIADENNVSAINATPGNTKPMSSVKGKPTRGRKPKSIANTIGVYSNNNSPYTPAGSPLASVDKTIKKPITARKKRVKKIKNEQVSSTKATSSNNLEFVDYFSETTFLVSKPSSSTYDQNNIGNNVPFPGSAANGDNSNDMNVVQKSNSANHKNDIVESLINGDEFGLNFLPLDNKSHNTNGEYENKHDDDDILLKSFLMDDDHFGGLDFNLNNSNTDLNNS